jgi:hypothetical protein
MCGKAAAVGVSSIAAFAFRGSGIHFRFADGVHVPDLDRETVAASPAHVASLLKTRNGTVQLAG